VPCRHHLKSENSKNSINFFSHSQLQYKLCGLINDSYYVTLPIHRCRSKQILGLRKMFARISPNLPEKFLCDFCLQIFSNKDHEDLFGVTSKKRFSCAFLQTLGAIFFKESWAPFLLGVSGILSKFSTKQNFWGCVCTPCTPASHTTVPIYSHAEVTIVNCNCQLAVIF